MKLVILLLISSIFLYFPAYAEDICFSEPTANKIIVDLELKKNYEEQIGYYKEGNKELEYQVKLLREVNSLQKEQITQYKDLMKLQKDGYESIIKESKPSFLHEVSKVIGFIGIGILIGLVL
jgi:hypothetical protein